MSKYQPLLEGSISRVPPHLEQADEQFALFFDGPFAADYNKRSVEDVGNAGSFISSIGDSNAAITASTTTATATDSSSNGSPNNSNITMEADDCTMEVPLLLHNNNNNDYEQHFFEGHQCQCEQPGFAANSRNKSAQDAKCKIMAAILLCFVFMLIELLGGLFAGSLAIMTDAAHLASDCISFIIGLVAIWLGNRPPDGKMSFGYKRMEVMGALISILSIWILTATLVIVAVQRIVSNDYDLDANTMMMISGIGIVINFVMICILHGSFFLPAGTHGHSHSHAHSHGSMKSSDLLISNGTQKHCKGEHLPEQNFGDKNVNLRAAIIHVIGDLVQSIGVFLAAVLIKCYPHAKYADPLCTLLFSVIVIMTTVRLFKESVIVLMDAVPKDICLVNLEMDLKQINGVKSVHHLNVWNHTTNHKVLMAHIVIDISSDNNEILNKASQLARSKYDIKHSTFQIERSTS